MAGEDADREKQQAARSLPYAEMEHAASSSNLTPRTNFEKMGMLLKIAVPGSEKKIALLVAGIIGALTPPSPNLEFSRLVFLTSALAQIISGRNSGVWFL